MSLRPYEIQGLDRIAGLAAELVRMAEDDPHLHDEEIGVYLDGTKARTREIGAELNSIGGWTAMSIVHTTVAQKTNSVAARHLDFSWDRIGEWRA